MAEAAEKRTPSRSAAGSYNPWLIVAIISIPTFMEVLDTSIANVALQYIAGGLSISPDEPLNPLYNDYIATASQALSGTGDGAGAALGSLYQTIGRQASMQAFLSVYWY